MTVLDPERPYTTYQRRELIVKLAKSKDLTIMEATEMFKAMEFDNPDGIAKLAGKFPKSPKKAEGDDD